MRVRHYLETLGCAKDEVIGAVESGKRGVIDKGLWASTDAREG